MTQSARSRSRCGIVGVATCFRRISRCATPPLTPQPSGRKSPYVREFLSSFLAPRDRFHRDCAQGEVIPKNILMIGPTGCGKTEIARRISKLAQAPFIKVRKMRGDHARV